MFDSLNAARAILPRLRESAARSERLRRLDDDAAGALRESGLTRIFTPKRFGGFELAPRAHLLASAELSRTDSAAGWVLMVCGGNSFVVGRFPEECQKEVFGNEPDGLVAGTLAPQGTIERVDGGFVLDGRWQFGSGCDNSRWFVIGARCVNPQDATSPLVYHLMVPAQEMEIDDTWHVLGMRGTGSKDLVAKRVFVPSHRTIPTFPAFLGSSPHASSPVYRLPMMAVFCSMVASAVLGIAEGGLARFVEKTKGRKDMLGSSKAQSGSMQRRVAESASELAAGRRLLEGICDRLDEAVAANRLPLPLAERVQIRYDAAYLVELSRRAIDRLYAAAGAHACYDESSLQRVYRDIHTATHHGAVDFDSNAELLGRVALGAEPVEDERAVPLA